MYMKRTIGRKNAFDISIVLRLFESTGMAKASFSLMEKNHINFFKIASQYGHLHI